MIFSHTYEDVIFGKAESFISEKIYELQENTYCREDEIKILVPNWFLDAYAHYLNNRIFNYIENKGNNYFMGKEILPNYKNEIVVYYTRFIENKQAKHFIFNLEEFLLNEKKEV